MPSPYVGVYEPLRLPLFFVGLVFLGCGVFTYLRQAGSRARVFLLYCVGNAIHFGGTFNTGGFALHLELLIVSVAATATAAAALLHLAIIFTGQAALRPVHRFLLYVFPGVVFVFAFVATSLPETVSAYLLGTALMLTALYNLVSAAAFARLAMTSRPSQRSRHRLVLVATAALGCTLLGFLGSVGLVLQKSDFWQLVHVLVPLALTAALVYPRGRSKDSSAQGLGAEAAATVD